jgi:hypothetical protein
MDNEELHILYFSGGIIKPDKIKEMDRVCNTHGRD